MNKPETITVKVKEEYQAPSVKTISFNTENHILNSSTNDYHETDFIW